MIIKGDIDGDGRITPIDAQYIIAYINNKNVLTEDQKIAADINGDGNVSPTDMLRILWHVNGIQLIDGVVDDEVV